MKIFISHSWKDKIAAQLIADSIGQTADVWLDQNKLTPGQHIQQTIDEAVKQMDLIILLWSKDSAASENVRKEIDAARLNGVRLLPCLLDETPLDREPALKGLLGLDMTDKKIGLFRIQLVVMRQLAENTGQTDVQALNDLKSMEGVANYVNDYRNKRGIAGEDAAQWALKILETTNRSFESLSKWKERTGDLLKTLQSAMAQVEEAGNDRAKLQSVLNELIRNQYSDTRELKLVIDFVQGKISQLPAPAPLAAKAEARPQAKTEAKPGGGAASAAADFNAVISELSEKIPRASRDSFKELRTQLLTLFPPAVVEQALDALSYYLFNAPANLKQFTAVAERSPSASLKRIAGELFNYLTNPQDIIPDDTNGLLGYLDDAWLIHNSIYRCIEAGLLDAAQIQTDWTKIITGDQLALRVFPPQIKGMLDELLTQYLRIIAEEMPAYQPAFNPDPANQSYNSYQASMGGGSPVIQNATSIDDIYYTVGDKGYLIR